jgi:hypothetical protein
VARTARDREPSHDGGSLWLFLLAIRLWHKYETGPGQLGESGEYWMGMAESALLSCSKLRGW